MELGSVTIVGVALPDERMDYNRPSYWLSECHLEIFQTVLVRCVYHMTPSQGCRNQNDETPCYLLQ